MTQSEMLELAAQAAGIKVHWGASRLQLWHNNMHGTTWNPLTNLGDRYDLARRLGMWLDFGIGNVYLEQKKIVRRFTVGNEKEEALAIVSAAAELGWQMLSEQQLNTEPTNIPVGTLANIDSVLKRKVPTGWEIVSDISEDEERLLSVKNVC